MQNSPYRDSDLAQRSWNWFLVGTEPFFVPGAARPEKRICPCLYTADLWLHASDRIAVTMLLGVLRQQCFLRFSAATSPPDDLGFCPAKPELATTMVVEPAWLSCQNWPRSELA